MKTGNPSNTIKLGQAGEDLAVQFLIEKGYDIIERNWRFKKAEIDIICRKDKVLIFVEVKAKSYTHFGAPEESISTYKENLIIDAASQYMILVGHEWEIRFDIISIVFNKDKSFNLNHFPDAFFPGI
ncbi:MAG: YraN family protein [Saprospiraceae bacterium]